MSTLPFIAHSDRLLVIVGASGAGKDTVLRAWRDRLGAARVHFAQRVITRLSDPHEGHESATDERFEQLIAGARLATWWRANGLGYGIRWRELDTLAHGGWVVVNGSRLHLPTLRSQAPALRAIEITAPTQVLSHRLAARGREEESAIQHRLGRQITASTDLTVTNDGPIDRAVDAVQRWWTSAEGGRAST